MILLGLALVLLGSAACGDDGGGATGDTGTTPTYTVTYDGNGGTGPVPTDNTAYTNGQAVTLASGSGLVQGGCVVICWTTNVAGTGQRFATGATVTLGTENLVFYAQYGLVPEMVTVPAKSAVSIGWAGVSTPVHAVASISAFRMGKYEVTWALWTNVRNWATNNGYTIDDGVMGDGSGDTPQHPVTSVSHYDVLAWCNALSERSGLAPVYFTETARTVVYKDSTDTTSTLVNTFTTGDYCVNWAANGYRLPTEAEWEYAARCKDDGSLSDGDKPAGYYGATLWNGATVLADWGPFAWYSGNSGSTTHGVGDRSPNALGLYDMSGNVWEWCWDWHGIYEDGPPYTNADTRGPNWGDSRVARGGSFFHDAFSLQVACRRYEDPGCMDGYLGFRLSRTE